MFLLFYGSKSPFLLFIPSFFFVVFTMLDRRVGVSAAAGRASAVTAPVVSLHAVYLVIDACDQVPPGEFPLPHHTIFKQRWNQMKPLLLNVRRVFLAPCFIISSNILIFKVTLSSRFPCYINNNIIIVIVVIIIITIILIIIITIITIMIIIVIIITIRKRRIYFF
jgi:hypothetical protein